MHRRSLTNPHWRTVAATVSWPTRSAISPIRTISAIKRKRLVLQEEGYVLLSFDEEAWRRGYRTHPVAEEVRIEVHEHLQRRLTELVTSGSRVVVDTAFWARASRDEYRALLAPLGVAPVVYYMQTPREVSLERLERRRDTRPNDIVLPVGRAIAYMAGFEAPTPDEGPVRVIQPGNPSTADRAPTH
ncbi:AAA family ATPase [Pengzhenrongella sp.]|jgi:hypothetical protein|uniref:AAA family ATPase n=1 Tax=Pengzhenrongella sp. TaxID=2888820 RepID=UPI002F939D91